MTFPQLKGRVELRKKLLLFKKSYEIIGFGFYCFYLIELLQIVNASKFS